MTLKAKSDFDSHDRKLTTAFLASPVIWFTHLTVSYTLVPQACVSGTRILLHLTTLLALAITIAAGAYCLQRLKLLGPGDTDDASLEARRRFMALAGTAFGLVFTLLIVATEIPSLIFRPCA